MEDAARRTPLQPLLYTLVVFSYVVHSNKTDDLQWGLVEHHCDSTKNGYLYKQKRTHANSWILHLAVRFRPRAVVNTPIPQVAGGAKDIPPRVAADVIRTRTIVVLLQPLYKPSGSEYGLRFRSYHSSFPSDPSITHETVLGTPKATLFQRARSAYTSAVECCKWAGWCVRKSTTNTDAVWHRSWFKKEEDTFSQQRKKGKKARSGSSIREGELMRISQNPSW